MDRPDLQRLLENYAPDNAIEAAFKPQMLDLLANTPNCFDRSCIPPGHFTGSCLVLGFDGEKTLMTHHRLLNRWLQLGGHADGNPDLLDVSLREAEEESGLTPVVPLIPTIFDIDIHTIPANPKRSEAEHLHYDVRFLLYTPQTTFNISEESHDLQWRSYPEAAADASSPSLARMLDKWHTLQQSGALPGLIAQAQKALENFN